MTVHEYNVNKKGECEQYQKDNFNLGHNGGKLNNVTVKLSYKLFFLKLNLLVIYEFKRNR